jgi:AcrR family transcriptional regulator
MVRRIGRPCQSDASDTRRRILDGARQSFTTRGYDNTTNREIAQAAGITAAAIYHYFPSKEELFVAVFIDVQRKVYDTFESVMNQHESFLARFDSIFDAMFDLSEHDPTLASFVVGVVTEAEHHPDLRDALKTVATRQKSFLQELCVDAQRRGELPESLPLQTAIDAMNGVIGGFARLAVVVRDRARLRAVAEVYKAMARSALARVTVG